MTYPPVTPPSAVPHASAASPVQLVLPCACARLSADIQEETLNCPGPWAQRADGRWMHTQFLVVDNGWIIPFHAMPWQATARDDAGQAIPPLEPLPAPYDWPQMRDPYNGQEGA